MENEVKKTVVVNLAEIGGAEAKAAIAAVTAAIEAQIAIMSESAKVLRDTAAAAQEISASLTNTAESSTSTAKETEGLADSLGTLNKSAADAATNTGDIADKLDGLSQSTSTTATAATAAAEKLDALAAAATAAAKENAGLSEKLEKVVGATQAVAQNTEKGTDSFSKNQEKVLQLQHTLTLASRAWHQFRAAISMFLPVMEEATKLMDAAATTGKRVSEVITLERAMKNLGAASLDAFEALPADIQSEALATAQKQVGGYAEQMERLAPTLADTRARMDDASQALQAGFATALGKISPLIQFVSATIEKLPIRFVATAILGLSGVMAGVAVNSVIKVANAVRLQAAAWLVQTKAVKDSTVALTANAAAARAAGAANAQTAKGSLGFFGGGKMGRAGGIAMLGSMALSALPTGTNEDGSTTGVSKAIGIGQMGLMGLGIGAMFGPIGAAIGGAAGLITGAVMEFSDDISAAVNPVGASLKNLAAAAEKARPAIASFDKTIEDYQASLRVSHRDRAINNEVRTSQVAGQIAKTPEEERAWWERYNKRRDANETDLNPSETPDEVLKRLQAAQQRHEATLTDINSTPQQRAAAVEGLREAADLARELVQLAAERKALQEEAANREVERLEAQQRLEMARLILIEKDEKKIHALRVRQQAELNELKRQTDTADNRGINAVNREADAIALQKEGDEKKKANDDARFEAGQRLEMARLQTTTKDDKAIADLRLKQLDEARARARANDTDSNRDINEMNYEAQRLALLADSKNSQSNSFSPERFRVSDALSRLGQSEGMPVLAAEACNEEYARQTAALLTDQLKKMDTLIAATNTTANNTRQTAFGIY